MKIAIISDIHGNLDALETVLDNIKQEKVDQIYILGDLAMAGPEPNETICFIREFIKNNNVEIIQGNTDEMIIKGDFTTGSFIPPNNIMANSLKYAQNTISQENKDFLSKLPSQKSIKIGKLSILLVHGSPRKNNEDIFPGRPIEEIEPMLEGVKEDLIFCGHTHYPAGYQISKKTLVNVGSVGRPFTEDQKSCFVILNIINPEQKEFEIEHLFVKYDAESAAQKLAKQTFEGNKTLADMLRRSSATF